MRCHRIVVTSHTSNCRKMKIIETNEMYSVNAGGISIIKKNCRYKNNGCKYVVSASYNNSWWCYLFTRGACELAASLCIDMHHSECGFSN